MHSSSSLGRMEQVLIAFTTAKSDFWRAMLAKKLAYDTAKKMRNFSVRILSCNKSIKAR
jgi:hypothetical protein